MGRIQRRLYLGASYETGGFRGLGYIMGGFTLGSYIDLENGMWQRSAVDVDLRWFSNLFLFKRSRIRQFLAFNYTQGWNRATGSDESIRFTRTDGLQALKEYIIGTNRMISTPRRWHSPLPAADSRIAVFGFADFGLIGYSPNIFKNDFFTSFDWACGCETNSWCSTRSRSGWAWPSANADWSRANISAFRTRHAWSSTATDRRGPRSSNSNRHAQKSGGFRGIPRLRELFICLWFFL